VLGGYATTAQPSILRKGKGGTLTDDLADLRGFRFATTTETTGAEEMDEARIKRLSGGDRVRARGMYKSSAEWDVMFLLWLATNFCPRLSSEDRALWNRFGPVDFPGLWTETGLAPDGTRCNRADPNLKTVLMAEASGILNWIIRHLEKLYTEGLREPKAVTAKRDELRGQQDTAGQFLADAMAADGADSDSWDPLLTAAPAEYGRTIRLTKVYQHYKAWAKDKCNPVGRQPFRASLKNHGYTITKNGNIEMAHGFGHQKSEAAQCPVCKEKLSS
jgi:phage/plasmid-associated DNA primase